MKHAISKMNIYMHTLKRSDSEAKYKLYIINALFTANEGNNPHLFYYKVKAIQILC